MHVPMATAHALDRINTWRLNPDLVNALAAIAGALSGSQPQPHTHSEANIRSGEKLQTYKLSLSTSSLVTSIPGCLPYLH